MNLKDLVRKAIGRTPRSATTHVVNGNTLLAPGNQWYSPAVAGISTFASAIMASGTIRQALAVLERLTPDAYGEYVTAFYRAGLERYGDTWRYADINTALIALAGGLRADTYLEIGVRRGRSLSMVASVRPECHILACDAFIPGYAGMDNPGPDTVRSELARVGFKGQLEFLVGNSHDVVPEHFRTHVDRYFDLITVDGDHSPAGALADLEVAFSRLKVGGALVFDDLSNPAHPELLGIWNQFVGKRPELSVFNFTELGFGIGVAIRHA